MPRGYVCMVTIVTSGHTEVTCIATSEHTEVTIYMYAYIVTSGHTEVTIVTSVCPGIILYENMK